MDEAIKTILTQWGAAGASIIAVGLYLIKRELAFQRREALWDTRLEERHKEVLALTEKVTAAIVTFTNSAQDLKDIIEKCPKDGR